MSWIVQTLLRNRLEIQSNPDLESDEYNDLLSLDVHINSLYSRGLLTDAELRLIDFMSGENTTSTEYRRMNFRVVQRKFATLCNKIAYHLGGIFTDDGYLEHMQNSYNLNDEQLEKIKLYMEGNHKHRLKRKPENVK